MKKVILQLIMRTLSPTLATAWQNGYESAIIDFNEGYFRGPDWDLIPAEETPNPFLASEAQDYGRTP